MIPLARQTPIIDPPLDRRPGHSKSLDHVADAEPGCVRVRGGVGFDRVAREDEARPDFSKRNASAPQQQAGRTGPSVPDDLRRLRGRQFVGADGGLGRPPCRERVEVCLVERSAAKA
ncbi:hypothetical protein [Trinickia dabaoshanensis]|uniref:hypothetical protein n=1 Tax=Trinickia dabaoshanensis TaxID=564714 RepID=UPI001E32A846|nr:hypothetical protein [Trinickia dabaoshanensis]